MIKKWDQFVNENKSTLEPIVIKSKKNDLFYIKIHFDKEGRVDKIENKWDVKIPDWYGFNINEIEVNNWLSRKEPYLYIEKSVNESKREKIFLNGYEMWLDRDKLMIYDSEISNKGIHFDVAGEGDGIYIHSQHLTKDEKRQISDYLKYGKQID